MDILSNAVVGTHFDPTGQMLEAYEFGVSKTIFEKLWEKYPGYDWKVKVDARPQVGMATIQLPMLMRQSFGYQVRLSDIASDPGLLVVTRGGGTLLELWNLRRGQADRAAHREAKDNHKVLSFVAKQLQEARHRVNVTRPVLAAA